MQGSREGALKLAPAWGAGTEEREQGRAGGNGEEQEREISGRLCGGEGMPGRGGASLHIH